MWWKAPRYNRTFTGNHLKLVKLRATNISARITINYIFWPMLALVTPSGAAAASKAQQTALATIAVYLKVLEYAAPQSLSSRNGLQLYSRNCLTLIPLMCSSTFKSQDSICQTWATAQPLLLSLAVHETRWLPHNSHVHAYSTVKLSYMLSRCCFDNTTLL